MQMPCHRAEVLSVNSLLPHVVEKGRGKGAQEERCS